MRRPPPRRRCSDIELDRLLDELEEALADARRVPFSSKIIVDEHRLTDIIDRLRGAAPDELKRARRLISEQERLLGQANHVVQQTLDEKGLMAAVEIERARLLDQARRDADTIRDGADEYARQVLEDMERRLSTILASIQNGLTALRP